ncbi:MAG: hypothetical protein K9N49_07665, partial [Candidatus Marinimicrobia bacterium]|nr:hypothetical protein [Candidatus Neomarinimicrobiota bacterium]
MSARRATCPRPPEARRGQALIFVVLAVVILAFVVLFVFDLHKTLFVKTRGRNAGDAAALAAARWQGIALNLVGDLNLLQAVAVSQALTLGADPEPVAAVLGDLAARVNFVAPLIGFAAAQQAAKNNGLFVNPAFTAALLNHAAEVANEYPRRYPLPPYRNDPEPPTAWDDYTGMLAELAAGGV